MCSTLQKKYGYFMATRNTEKETAVLERAKQLLVLKSYCDLFLNWEPLTAFILCESLKQTKWTRVVPLG